MSMEQVIKELAPTGVLRAAINVGNKLMVTGTAPNGDPTGVSPSMAAAIAERLGVPIKYISYPKPTPIAADGGTGKWDIGNIGAEPQRAEKIFFTAAYCEIEATYLVPPGSAIQSIADVDKPGVRIAVNAGAAYELWLDRNIKHAKLMRSTPEISSWDIFTRDKLEAYAGLKPALLKDVAKLPGSRMLEGNFATVNQAVATDKRNLAAAKFLSDFVEEAKRTGLVARFIEEHKVKGLSVAPLA